MRRNWSVGIAAAVLMAGLAGCRTAESMRREVGGPVYTLEKLPPKVEGPFAIELDARQTKMLLASVGSAEGAGTERAGRPALVVDEMPDGGSLVKPWCPHGCRLRSGRPEKPGNARDGQPRGAEADLPPAMPGGPPPGREPEIDWTMDVEFECDCDHGDGEINPGHCDPVLRIVRGSKPVFGPDGTVIGHEAVQHITGIRVECNTSHCQKICHRREHHRGRRYWVTCDCEIN